MCSQKWCSCNIFLLCSSCKSTQWFTCFIQPSDAQKLLPSLYKIYSNSAVRKLKMRWEYYQETRAGVCCSWISSPSSLKLFVLMYSCVSEMNKKAKCLYILYLLHVINISSLCFYLIFMPVARGNPESHFRIFWNRVGCYSNSINTVCLHNHGRLLSRLQSLTEAVCWALYQSISTESELEGKSVVEKCAHAAAATAALTGLSKKVDLRTESFIKNELMSVCQEPPLTDVSSKGDTNCHIPNINPLLNHEGRSWAAAVLKSPFSKWK